MDTYWTIFLILGLTISGWLLGGYSYFSEPSNKYCPGYDPDLPETACYSETGEGSFNIWDRMISYALTWNGAFAIIGAVALTTLAIAGGLNLLVIVPFMLVFILLDFMILPIKFITDSMLPFPIPLIIQIFIYILVLLSLLSFVRTGQ